MRKVFWICLLILPASVFSQTYITRNGNIQFKSKTPLEDIYAENRQVYAVIDVPKKNLAFTCLVKGFLFKKELMQQHFNENYVESDRYPKANFIGSYTGEVDTKKDGIYAVEVQGKLYLHGVTQQIVVPASIEVSNKKLIGTADFKLTPADFNIKIPSLVKDKIAKQIDVHVLVECTLK